MRKTVVAAVTLASATALTGAAAGSSSAPAADARATHVLKWRTNGIASDEVGISGWTRSEVVTSRRTGADIGYDSITGDSVPGSNRVKMYIAFAVEGGIIVARAHTDFEPPEWHGKVLSGAGKFKGITGTLRVREARNTLVTMRVKY